MISINLIHEVVEEVLRHSSREKLLSTGGMDPRTREHLEAVRQELQVDELLGIGIWIDGTPYNWDRTESLEVISVRLRTSWR